MEGCGGQGSSPAGAARGGSLDPSRFAAAIFDLDGTLVLTEPAWEEAKRRVLARHGIGVAQALLDAHVGCGLGGFLHAAMGPELAAELGLRVAGEIEAEADLLLPALRAPVPGAADLAADLARRGLRIAICSSSPRRYIAEALALLGLAHLPEVVVSGAELPRGKPDPLPYRATLAALGLPPGAAFALEDSVPGARAAKAAGLVTVAVGAGCSAAAYGFCDLQAEDYAALAARLAPA